MNVKEEEDIDVIMDAAISDLLNTPSKHIVVFNDSINSFDHVIECLQRYCKKSPEAAYQLTYQIHCSGKSTVYSSDDVVELEIICNLLCHEGLNAEIK